MYGYMLVSSTNYLKFVRLDNSDNVVFTTGYAGSTNIQACEIDNTETNIYILQRSATFDLSIFNAANGLYLQRFTTTALSSNSARSTLIIDSSNTMVIVNVNDASGNLAICKFTILSQAFNCIKITGSASPLSIGVLSTTDDIFYTALISSNIVFQRITTTTPAYTYKISGASTSLIGYSGCAISQDKSQIYTFHGYGTSTITGPMYVSLNVADGSPSSLLYNFQMTCGMIYHVDMKDSYLYATGYCSSLLFIFEFNTGTNTFSLFSYTNGNLIPYYLVIDSNSDRIINAGYDCISSCLWYLAKIPKYQISAYPDVIVSTYTSNSRTASTVITSTASPTIASLAVTLTSASLTSSTSSTFNVNSAKTLSSSASYNLAPYTESSLNSNTFYSFQLVLTCTVTGADSITYSLVSCQGGNPPSWVTLDTSNGLLNCITQIETTQTTYTFCVSSQVSGDTTAGLKLITLTVMPTPPCTVTNCDTCVTGYPAKCSSCSSGYTANSDSSACNIIPAATSQSTTSSSSSSTSTNSASYSTAQISALSSVGVTIGISAVLSALNASSFIVIWTIFNQMRVLILMLLTEAYFPFQVNNYLIGLKLFSFNFSFLFIEKIPGVNIVTNWFDFTQPQVVLQDIGLISQSSLFNNINLLFILFMIVVLHITARIILKCMIRCCCYTKFKRLRDLCNKIIKLFEFGVYIRILLESTQFILISTFSELKIFDDSSTLKKESLGISFMFTFIIFLFWVFIFILWNTKGKDKNLKNNSCWYDEVFKGTNEQFCSRGYTFLMITRTILLTSFLIFSRNYLDNLTGLASSKIYFLFLVQLIYTICIISIRPLNRIESKLVQISTVKAFVVTPLMKCAKIW